VTDVVQPLAKLKSMLETWGITVSWDLLREALTHSSYANENDTQSNERLEFLGDAVLELVVSEYLYRTLPQEPEGVLTRRRAALVCEETLATGAVRLNLGETLRLGRGEESQGGRERPALLADAVEAVIGAVYLSGGLEAARTFIRQLISPYLSGELELRVDYKTELQELLQRSGDVKIEYRVVRSVGPDHARRFTVALAVNGAERSRGQGASKKEAEQHAARELLLELEKN
jgi:ribonuclease-3